jgi:hypothetical protein
MVVTPAGLWIASDFQGEFAGIKYEGHGLDGYDANFSAAWRS